MLCSITLNTLFGSKDMGCLQSLKSNELSMEFGSRSREALGKFRSGKGILKLCI